MTTHTSFAAFANHMVRAVLVMALMVALIAPSAAQSDEITDLAQQAREAVRAGDLPKALDFANRAARAAPKEVGVWMLRAEINDLRRDHVRTIADYGEALKRNPSFADAWQQRGAANFRAGKTKESVSDFDHYLELVPTQKPYHWQRGISLYYAGRFAEGKKQFALHQTVNPHDVENAVWHFLCTARAEGIEAARKQLIPIEGDSRVPMAEVHRLFAGKGSPEEVMAAAEAASRKNDPSSLFYGHLYLGLYYEAVGDTTKMRDHILKAAARAKENGYMGDVASVHAGKFIKMNEVKPHL